MASSSSSSHTRGGGLSPAGQGDGDGAGGPPSTTAAFSPASHFSSTRQRSTILVHQKSPLLLATPPQVTRALAYSHPFITPLNRLAGLFTWTTGDPWESFLLVAAFWFVTLYGDHVVRYAGPPLLVTLLIVGMYLRRYSPLSSTGWTSEKWTKGHRRDPSETQIKHRNSLDEILATLQTFTTRCNIILDPLLRLTDFLSTQQTATSATTQPALTTLFIRIMLACPVWWALTLPPLRIITTKRIVLVFGTIVLSWHSRPARISRTILWRSRSIRLICTTITGLEFTGPSIAPKLPPRPVQGRAASMAALAAKKNGESEEGIRFTFTLYENQRRWLGIGWTSSMLAYERTAWTDEHLNPTLDPQHFILPDVEGGMARWRWAEDGEWHVEPTPSKSGKAKEAPDDEEAWIYYDNKWRDGRRGQDGWGRYTRRRKWIRDAELVDIIPDATPVETSTAAASDVGTDDTTVVGDSEAGDSSTVVPSVASSITTSSDVGSSGPGSKRKSWFGHGRNRTTSSASASGSGSDRSRFAASEDHVLTPTARLKEREADWGLSDDVSMELG
ncbi:hypothetical protein MBLNU459_g6041t1 [Dothideomycetes sp. NU459]